MWGRGARPVLFSHVFPVNHQQIQAEQPGQAGKYQNGATPGRQTLFLSGSGACGEMIWDTLGGSSQAKTA